MQLTISAGDGATVVTVEEKRLDAAIATHFKDRMREIVVAQKQPIILDLHNVDFMDSSGLGAVIAVHKAMPEGVPLVLSGLTPNVSRVFRLTRMDTVFSIIDSTELKREAG